MEAPNRKIKLQNINIYSSLEHLYLYKGDHKLFKIEGEERQLVEYCIDAIKTSETVEEAYNKIKDKLEEDEEFFLQILEWLDENEVIELEKTDEEEKWEVKTKEVIVVSSGFTKEEVENKIISTLNEKGRKLKLKQFIDVRNDEVGELEEADLILLFSPVFEHYQKVYDINRQAYEKGIMLFHVGMEQNTITLGPVVDSGFKTPCISCYLKRKITNLSNPKDFVKFMEIHDKKSLNELKLVENKYFDLMMSLLNLELEKVFIYNGMFSPLLGNSILFDPIGMFTEKSTIVKISDCTVCNTRSHYYPF
ncbi:MAG: hypothetical protein ACEPOV_02055 [Hyphomicrobiales bacterium]